MKHSPEEDDRRRFTCFSSEKQEDVDDDSFSCFGCKERFPTMKLFCQHMKTNHRQMNSNGIGFRRETETKAITKCSPTGKRGRRQAAGDEFLSVYHGSLVVSQVKTKLEEEEERDSTRKRRKTEDSMPKQVALSAFSEPADNECKSVSSHGRKLKNPRPAKAVKSVHQCEICGKMFGTGQALGGHKTSHRMKVPLVK
ncbi:hypothetical protein GQ457_16G006960 [Hibiscus cannabinus]